MLRRDPSHDPGRRRVNSVLVTGGAGFIGSHLVDSLLADGWRVTVVDNFDASYARGDKEGNIAPHRACERLRVIEADVRDLDTMHARLDGAFDVVVHLAARTGVRASIADPLAYQDVNVRGTHTLLELCRSWQVRHFVFASSSSVYGVNPRTPWREDDRALPVSPYASTKASAELLGHVYASLFGIRFVALRLFTVYGPRLRPDLAIRTFAERMLAGRPIPLFGDGGMRRDYTYVTDAVAGIRAAMRYAASAYEVINIGSQRAVSLDELVAGLERALGVKARVERLPEQMGDVPHTCADVTKARALLGYEPTTSLDDGLLQVARWLGAVRAQARD